MKSGLWTEKEIMENGYPGFMACIVNRNLKPESIFSKLETLGITTPDNDNKWLDSMLAIYNSKTWIDLETEENDKEPQSFPEWIEEMRGLIFGPGESVQRELF